ncbi:Arp2/3 complex-mediated actin nucleation [Dermatophagoides farinae]|uniref:Arp2/3 complex-mediated actin nucleation n=1 Tax=Dermatophagoides farinae TaxID=6954 RepID=A0A922HNR7_DERFA|nr:Arp2/3 complex-mediated actin nucleation [Dermatophagoides farinae]
MAFQFIATPENLRREELMVQIAERLKLIDSYSETLFKRLDIEFQNVQTKLQDINKRTDICAKKISLLKDEKKAITLYSHSKYPSHEIKVKEFYDSFLILDRDIHGLATSNHNSNNDNDDKRVTIDATHVPYDDDSKMKSQFYIYDKKPNKSSIPDHLSESNIPWRQISSLSSLLLFNSSENAYTIGSPTTFAKRCTQTGNKIKSNESDSQKFTESTSTSEKTDVQDDDFQLTFHTKPDILDDLPAELPSLPGIADEFRFKDTGEMDIIGHLNLPDLASLSKSTFSPSSPPSSNQSEPIVDINVDKLPKLPISVEYDVATPPFIPPPTTTTTSSSPHVNIQQSISQHGQLDNGRASLLESIRAAGGKPKKKTIKERKHDEKLKKKDALEDSITESPMNTSNQTNNNNKGLDMMAELRKRLESRRSGISSDHQHKSNNTDRTTTIKLPTFDAASTMANMSALIPPPSTTTSNQRNDDNGDDDDDDDDENDKNFEDWD